MTDGIRIGVIGLGGICRERHAPGFNKINGVSLCAVANRSRASSERAARDYAIPVVCDSWQEIIHRDDINVVLVGTWPYLHCEASVAALEAGKHVFCQARMARNAEEAEHMCAAWRASGRVAGLCPVPIGMRFDRVMARLLAENTIGTPRYVSVRSLSGAWTDPAAPITWRKDATLSGLNMQTLGMYIEVIHRWLGDTREVSAATFLHTPERPDAKGDPTPVQVPDQIILNAVVGDALPVQYCISGMSAVPEDTIDIYGDKGALHYDVNKDALCLKGADGVLAPVAARNEELYDVENWSVEKDFVAAIRDGRPYHPDFSDGLRYMRVIQAAYDSAASRRHVALPETH